MHDGVVKTPRGLAGKGAPEASAIVTEIITGRRAGSSSKRFSMANRAALALRVSKMVSTRRISAPPSTSARAAS